MKANELLRLSFPEIKQVVQQAFDVLNLNVASEAKKHEISLRTRVGWVTLYLSINGVDFSDRG